MTDDHDQTNSPTPEFDFSAFPDNTVFHERREERERAPFLRPARDDPQRPSPDRPAERRQKTNDDVGSTRPHSRSNTRRMSWSS